VRAEARVEVRAEVGQRGENRGESRGESRERREQSGGNRAESDRFRLEVASR
jgi:hypothetical protein